MFSECDCMYVLETMAYALDRDCAFLYICSYSVPIMLFQTDPSSCHEDYPSRLESHVSPDAIRLARPSLVSPQVMLPTW